MTAAAGGPRLYVYALLAGRMRPPRIGGHHLEIVAVGDLFAVVEPLAAPPALSEAVLREQHQIVVRLDRVAEALLPVRFGAFVAADDLADILRERRPVLRAALERVRGQVQMTVRIFGQPRSRRAAPPPASGAAYLRARAAAVRVPRSAAATAIRAAVAPIVSAERAEPGRRDVLLTLNHLVPRGAAAPYRGLVDAALATLATPPAVVVSGPWPPFAFTPDLWSDAEVPA